MPNRLASTAFCTVNRAFVTTKMDTSIVQVFGKLFRKQQNDDAEQSGKRPEGEVKLKGNLMRVVREVPEQLRQPRNEDDSADGAGQCDQRRLRPN